MVPHIANLIGQTANMIEKQLQRQVELSRIDYKEFVDENYEVRGNYETIETQKSTY